MCSHQSIFIQIWRSYDADSSGFISAGELKVSYSNKSLWAWPTAHWCQWEPFHQLYQFAVVLCDWQTAFLGCSYWVEGLVPSGMVSWALQEGGWFAVALTVLLPPSPVPWPQLSWWPEESSEPHKHCLTLALCMCFSQLNRAKARCFIKGISSQSLPEPPGFLNTDFWLKLRQLRQEPVQNHNSNTLSQ